VGKVEGNILIYVQQDATLHSLFCLETALHVSGGTTTHHQERKQLYLQHLVFVALLLLPAAIAAGSSNSATSMVFFLPMLATFPAHLIALELIIIIMSDQNYKFRRSIL
jgi:hypothetical protein